MATEPEDWNGMPNVPADFVWSFQKSVMFQRKTKKGYEINRVLSSLEKAIVCGDVNQAHYWAVEYLNMGTAFVDSLWKMLQTVLVDSIGLANLACFTYFNQQHALVKSLLPAREAGSKVNEESVAVPEPILKAVLETVRQMALTPKSRLVDSTVSNFVPDRGYNLRKGEC